MSLDLEGDDLSKFILVGDRVLVKPKNPPKKTKSGLYLPPGVEVNDKVHSGYVIKVGPGYPIPNMMEVDEPWIKKAEQLKFIPLQPEEGDLAVYLQKSGYEIQYNMEKYIIIPQSAILMLIRDDELFD